MHVVILCHGEVQPNTLSVEWNVKPYSAHLLYPLVGVLTTALFLQYIVQSFVPNFYASVAFVSAGNSYLSKL